MTDAERRSEEDAIRELLDRQVMGWAAGDAEPYASMFTTDADYVTFLGSHGCLRLGRTPRIAGSPKSSCASWLDE
jgi:hypothetical protein